MGDRREFQDGNEEYFQLLELIMTTMSVEVVDKGLQKPLFHVFSETLVPCPSENTGLFDEFPTWPVGVDQVRKNRGSLLRCTQYVGCRSSVSVRSSCATDPNQGGQNELHQEFDLVALVKLLL